MRYCFNLEVYMCFTFFIRKYFGLGYFFLVFIADFFMIRYFMPELSGGKLVAMYLIFVIFSLIGLMSVNLLKPSKLLDSMKFVDLLFEKIFWHVIAPIFAIILIPTLVIYVNNNYSNTPSSLEDIKIAKKDYKFYCNKKQMIKTGSLKCDETKNKLKILLNNDLTVLNSEAILLENETFDLIDNQKLKCSKDGLIKYGTDGCDEANYLLNDKENKLKIIKEKIELLNKEILELK